MKKGLILLVILGFTIARVYAQNQPIVIKGQVNSEVTKLYNANTLILRAKESSNKYSDGIRYECPIVNGRFKIEISTTDTLLYLSFEFKNNRDNAPMKGLLFNASYRQNRPMKEVYLFKAGDSISVNINKNGTLQFTGKGSDKLDCQSQVYNIEPIPAYSIGYRSSQVTNIKYALSLLEESVNSAIRVRLEIIKSYKDQVTNKVYDLLRLDAISSANYALFFELYSMASLRNKDSENISKFYQTYNSNSSLLDFHENDAVASAYYADMLFEKELNSFRLDCNAGIENRNDIFTKMFNRVKSYQKGLLRDKLFLIYFERLSQTAGTKIEAFKNKAIDIMISSKYKKLLVKVVDKNKLAFPFDNLFDINDKEHKLTDYRNKLLIIDFWFTGCTPCLSLAKSMNSVFDQYRNNPDVVFITISTDSKSTWLKSIASGLYTAEGMINLHTKGLGFDHPLIKNYNFRGFPRQVIIGKNNNLITLDPPPVNGGKENRLEFIQLINNNLIN